MDSGATVTVRGVASISYRGKEYKADEHGLITLPQEAADRIKNTRYPKIGRRGIYSVTLEEVVPGSEEPVATKRSKRGE